TPKNISGFVLLSGIELGGLTGPDQFNLRKSGCGPLILISVGVAGLVFLADGERVNQRYIGGCLDSLAKCMDEGGNLIAGPWECAFDLAQVDTYLVQDNQGGFATKEFLDCLSPRSDMLFVGRP